MLKDAHESTVARIEAIAVLALVEHKDSGKRCERVSDIDPTTATCWQNGQKTKDNALEVRGSRTRCQLGGNCHAGYGSIEASVVVDGMIPGLQHRPNDGTFWPLDSRRRQEAKGWIREHGDKNWKAIAALVPSRTISVSQ
jgi:hypothetical protein